MIVFTILAAIGAAFIAGIGVFILSAMAFDRFATGDEGLGYVWLAGVFGIIAAVLAGVAVFVGGVL